MFSNYKSSALVINNVSIHFVVGGSGPPLLLLHGYPQSHYMWHKIFPLLAKKYTVVASDLRGYGDSSKPPSSENHEPYSKREMAKDQVLLMEQLEFRNFFVAGHDRGGRVAHRMALDHPHKVRKLAVMDIAPTYTMYTTTDLEFAKAYYHWFFLIQPYDFPERMISADPEYYLTKKLGQWGKDKNAFAPEALSEYRRCFTPETIHASCEDYRASASIDLEHDKIDMAQGNKISCPILVLWGKDGFVGNKYHMVSEWSKWAEEVVGYELSCGHYLPEEAPEQTLLYLQEFFKY